MANQQSKIDAIASQDYELVPIDAVRPHPRNVNHGNVDVIVESIKTNKFFGCLNVQRSTGYILAGKHRWLAAKVTTESIARVFRGRRSGSAWVAAYPVHEGDGRPRNPSLSIFAGDPDPDGVLAAIATLRSMPQLLKRLEAAA